ncbi:hypothetical protein [Shouchella miscanthi]|uniref:hypothetical protein n=1 Tax=Shouchella miscanthi TaxID=2598861 RepID=UPI0011A7DD50|nr:hypothetical protein [Shouchella miscanthi]
MYIEYLMMVHARTPQTKEEKKAQDKFAQELKPKEFIQQKKGPAKVYKWDEGLMNRLKAEQQKRLNM